MLHWWCSLFVFITVYEEELFHVKSFLQTWSLTLKINSEQRLVGGHCKQTLLNKTRGNFTMEVGLVKMGLILSLQTDVNPIRRTSSRVYQQLFWVFLFDCCKVPNIPTAKKHTPLVPWCHVVLMCHDVMHTAPIIVTRSNIEPEFVTCNKNRGSGNKIQSHIITLSFMNPKYYTGDSSQLAVSPFNQALTTLCCHSIWQN